MKQDLGKSLSAIVGGYLVMGGIGFIGFFLLSKLLLPTPAPNTVLIPSTLYLSIILCANFLSGMAGGYVAAAVSGTARFQHALILAGIILTIGILVAIFSKQLLPVWYTYTAAILVPVAVVVGGWLRSRKP